MARFAWEPKRLPDLKRPNHNALREGRQGVMIHYDGSGSDPGALAWFEDPRFEMSYHWGVLDDGSYVLIVPEDRRAYHAGVCRPSSGLFTYNDANSALYGISVLTNDKIDVTPLQTLTAAWLAWQCFRKEGWPISELWRITGHEHEAHPRGRKKDPSGGLKDNPILTVEDIRQLMAGMGD